MLRDEDWCWLLVIGERRLLSVLSLSHLGVLLVFGGLLGIVAIPFDWAGVPDVDLLVGGREVNRRTGVRVLLT